MDDRVEDNPGTEKYAGLVKVFRMAVYIHMAVGVFLFTAINFMIGWDPLESITRFDPLHWPLVAAIEYVHVVFLALVLADAAALYILHTRRGTAWRRRIVVSYLVGVPVVAVLHVSAALAAATVGVFQDATGASLSTDPSIGVVIAVWDLAIVSPVVLVALAEWLRRPHPVGCANCGYDCRGLARCPECGKPVEAEG